MPVKGSPDEISKILDAAEDVLDYRFKERTLLEAALTHPSAAEHSEISYNYERLEFLGDSILGAIIADEAFRRFPDLEEGGLTRIKVALVSGAMLSKISDELGIADLILFGDSEVGTRGRGLHSALENVFESLVGALYLDGGMRAARVWVLNTLGPHIDKGVAAEPESPKCSLQERLQAQHRRPIYKIIATVGPPHNRHFEAAVSVDGVVMGTGNGRSKKEAEVAAAAEALKRLGASSE